MAILKEEVKKIYYPGEKLGILQKIKLVLFSPNEFFYKVEAEDIKPALIYFLVLYSITSIGIFIYLLFFSPYQSFLSISEKGVTGFSSVIVRFIATYAAGIIGLFIGSAITHIFVKIFRGTNYNQTFKAYAYGSTPGLLITIPLIILLLPGVQLTQIPSFFYLILIPFSLWSLYLISKGLGIFHSRSFLWGLGVFLIGFFILFSIRLAPALVLSRWAESFQQQSEEFFDESMRTKAVVKGYVRNLNGEPQQGVRIRATTIGGTTGSEDTSTTSNADGNYTLPLKRFPATYRVTVVGYEKEISEIIELDVEKNITLNLTLPTTETLKAILEGTIENLALEPLSGVTITATETGVSTQTDDDGYYKLENLEPIWQYVNINSEGYEPLRRWMRIDAGYNKRDFTLLTVGTESGGVDGYIKDNSGNTIPNARILILLGGEPTIINADSTGHYKVTPLDVGENSVVAITDGYSPEREVVEVTSNVISKRDFSLRKMANFYGYFAGFVLDNENNPLDADIVISKTDKGTFRLTHNAVKGGYGTGFNPGIYNLNVTADGFKTHEEPVELKLGEMLIKNVILERE